MFSGIVEEIGTVKSVQPGKLVITARKVLEGTRPGDSIAVNGACLTVTNIVEDAFSVELMPETLRRTNLGILHPNDKVNLERALKANGRLGGHFVQGHVDGMGRILSLRPEEEAVLMRISVPPEIARYLVEKGFIAVDGVSLTIVECEATSFTVSLVSYTRQNTTLGSKLPGDLVNLEVDIIAKYVEQLSGKNKPGITREFLAQHGFLTESFEAR